MTAENVNWPAVHAAVPLEVKTHSDIEMVSDVLRDGHPALVSIEPEESFENGQRLQTRSWA